MTYAASINVSNAKAKLVVAGDAPVPVLFTSYKDDSACGVGAANEPVCDTNGDGATSRPRVTGVQSYSRPEQRCDEQDQACSATVWGLPTSEPLVVSM